MVGSVPGSSAGASGELASAAYHSSTGAVFIPLRRLRPGCILNSVNGVQGTVLGLPTALQAGRSLYFAPAADAPLVCTAHSPARAYLLWPALQATPDWLHADWTPVRGAELRVRWAGFSLKQRAWLNITNQRSAYAEQPLLLYTLASNSGVLPPGAQLQLPGLSSADESGPQEAPCQLVFPPAVVLCNARGDTTKLTPAAASAVSAVTAQTIHQNGRGDSMPGGLQLLAVDTDNLATCPLEDVCFALEEGMFDASNLGQAAADALLHRSMAAGDDESLLMLVQADVCLRCSMSALQLLLHYACQKDLLPLAEHLLCCTSVELAPRELTWLVGSLVTSRNMYEAERLLAGYVLARRNALSSTAVIEYALVKAASASLVPNQDAMQLAMRFRAAKHTLLRQLMQRYSDDQKGSAAAGLAASPAGTLGGGSLQTQLSSIAGSMRSIKLKQGNGPLMLLDPLLHIVKLCLQELSTHVIGRGKGSGRCSIHDSSPYSLAVVLQDSEFLGIQPVQDYTRLIWHGLELHKMRRVTWQAMASADEAAAADGPFSSMQRVAAAAGHSRQLNAECSGMPSWLHAAVGGARITGSCRVTADAAEPTPVRQYRITAGDSTSGETARVPCRVGPGPIAEGVAGGQVNFDSHTAHAAVPAGPQSIGSWTFASSSSSTAYSHSSKPAAPAGSSVAGWTGTAHRRRTAPGNRTMGPGGSAASRRAAGGIGSAAAAATDSSWMDQKVGYDLLQNLGLAGGFGARLMLLGAMLLHGVLLAPRALHDSSWGRWVKRMVFEVLFLVVFQMTVMGGSKYLLLFVLTPLLLGNVLDIFYQIKFKWDGNLMTYLQDHWSKLDVLVNFGMLAVVLWEFESILLPHKPVDVFGLEQYGIHIDTIVQSAFAVLVWSRALGLLTPLSSKLGAMLYILRRGAEEAGVLLPVVVVLMLGFGTTLTVAYHTTEPKFSTLAGAMRMLAAPADLRLAEFDTSGDGNPFMVVWGQVVLILYIAVVNILIMSLLIAVITHAYNPDSIKAHAIVMQAESTLHYDFHVRHALPCSPVNMVQLLFAWMPLGYRSRMLPAACLKWWVPPLDGYVPEPIASSPAMLLVTGPSEIGYLAFMFLMYPLFSVTGLVLLAVCMPLSVVHFAIKGHKVWLESSWSGGSSTLGEDLPPAARATLAAAAASLAQDAAGVSRSRASLEVPATPIAGRRQRGTNSFEQQAPWLPRGRASLGDKSATGGGQQLGTRSFELEARRGSAAAPGLSVRPPSLPGGAPVSGPASPAAQQRRSKVSSQQISQRMAVQQRGLLHGLARLLLCSVTIVIAAGVGTVAYTLLLLGLVLVLLWAWATRTVFSLYCIFIPHASDIKCCLKLTRAGDFWGVADTRAAFAAAKLSMLHTQQLVQLSEGQGSLAGKPGYDASCTVAVAPRPAAGAAHTGRNAATAAEEFHAAPRRAAEAQATHDSIFGGSTWDITTPGSSDYCSGAGAAAPTVTTS